MSYGLQVYNSSGQIRLDVDDTTSRLWAIYTGSTPSNKIVTVPGIANNGEWYIWEYGNNNFSQISLRKIIINTGSITLDGYNTGQAYKFAVGRIG